MIKYAHINSTGEQVKALFTSLKHFVGHRTKTISSMTPKVNKVDAQF